MSIHVYRGQEFQTGHERLACGEFLQDLLNRCGETDIPYYVIGEFEANAAHMDLLLITSKAIIIVDLKELTAIDKRDADKVQIIGQQNGPWKYALPNSQSNYMGGKGKKDNPYQQLVSFRYEFADWMVEHSLKIFGFNLNKSQILDRLYAWCVVSPGFDGVTNNIDLPWGEIKDKHNWFRILSSDRLAWDFYCASNSLVEISKAQIHALISQLGVTECNNLAEVLPVPPPVRDPFFSRPHISENMVDRLVEKQKLIQILEDERTSVVSLRGLGGVGKTEIAAWLSPIAEGKNYDVRWIDCSEKEVTAESFLAAVASEISDHSEAELVLNQKTKLVDRMETALNHLAKKHTLIILNDFHKVSDKNGLDQLLTHIVHHYKEIKVILTTREYPGCIDNPRWRPGAAKDIQIEGLPQDSISEYISLDTTANPAQEWVDIIYERTSGNPYALRLVSALARKYGWGEQVTRLQLFNAAQSQESQEWFASLVETISENAKQLVHRLSVVRTGLTDDLINSLWRQSEEARLLTRELIESCILQPSEDSNTYLLHEFIREYLYEQTPKDLRQKIHRDAGKYFLKNSQEATDKNIQAELLAEALFHFKQAQDSKTIQEFATQCHELLIKRGDRDRAQTVATYALEAAHVLKDDEDSANWLVRIAEREIEHDQLKEGGRHLDKAINVLKNMPVKLSPQQDERKKNLLSHAYLLKGRLAYLVSNFSAAEEIFKEALECARCASNKHEDVYCLIMMGHLARQKKDYDEAYQLFQQASDLATRIKDPELENECFSHLGLISRRRGDFEDAKMRFTQVYENAKKQGNRRVEQTNLNLLGDLYLRLGEYSKAEPLFRQGLNLARKYAIGQGIRICLGQLAEVLVYKGEYAEAQQYLEEDERLSEQVDDGIALAWTISRKGLLIKAQGEKERGNQLILSAIQKLREKGNEDYITDFERFLNLYQ